MSGTELMRLFLSPSVEVYSSDFKGSEQQRTGCGELLSQEQEQETEDADLGRGWEVARAPEGFHLDACTCEDRKLTAVTG